MLSCSDDRSCPLGCACSCACTREMVAQRWIKNTTCIPARRPEDFALSLLVLTRVFLPAISNAKDHVHPPLHPCISSTHTHRPKSQASLLIISRKQEKPFGPVAFGYIHPAQVVCLDFDDDTNNSSMMTGEQHESSWGFPFFRDLSWIALFCFAASPPDPFAEHSSVEQRTSTYGEWSTSILQLSRTIPLVDRRAKMPFSCKALVLRKGITIRRLQYSILSTQEARLQLQSREGEGRGTGMCVCLSGSCGLLCLVLAEGQQTLVSSAMGISNGLIKGVLVYFCLGVCVWACGVRTNAADGDKNDARDARAPS